MEEKEGIIVKEVKNVRSKRALFISRLKRRILGHVWLVRIVGIAAIFAILFAILYGAFLLLKPWGISRYAGIVNNFIFTPDKIESSGGRTNILVLGKGGAGHEAPDLTDTMIFISVPHDKKDLLLVSLPRDIWIPELRAKLNSAYYWGNKKSSGGGKVLAKALGEQIMGQPIHYTAVVDFSGVSGIVDALGGVDVEIETSFVDDHFPIIGREGDKCGGDPKLMCRYETVKFERGVEHMDGTRALKFIRSRYAQGDEGTDFARSARQQKVIAAIEKKMFTTDFLLSPNKIKNFIDVLEKSIETDIDEPAGAILARYMLDSKDRRKSYVLGEDFLVNPPISTKYDNLYVFVPKDGTWDKVHEWVQTLLGY